MRLFALLSLLITQPATALTYSGLLDKGGLTRAFGELYDTLTIDMAVSGVFTVELISYSFDGYFRVTAPSGQTWRNDDAGSTTLSRINNLVGAEGERTVDVTSVLADEVGAYNLRMLVFPE